MAQVSKQKNPAALLLDQALPDIIRFARNVESQRLARFGLSLTQYFTMATLDHNGDLMMKELGCELDLSMGAITGIVDKLAEMDIVSRYTVESDRRVVKARLTEKGHRLFDSVQADRLESLSESMGKLSVDDVKVFLNVLNTLIGSLDVEVWGNPE